MKAKSPSSGGEGFSSAVESLRHLLGKGPGSVGSLLGKGVKKQQDISLSQPSALEQSPGGARPRDYGSKASPKLQGSGPLVLCLWHPPFLTRFRVASEVDQVV